MEKSVKPMGGIDKTSDINTSWCQSWKGYCTLVVLMIICESLFKGQNQRGEMQTHNLLMVDE